MASDAGLGVGILGNLVVSVREVLDGWMDWFVVIGGEDGCGGMIGYV